MIPAANPGIQGKNTSPTEESLETLAEAALAQITAQLNIPERGGKVWIDDWNWRFAPSLGQLRAFMESHPDKFVIYPGEGRRFTVGLVGSDGGDGGNVIGQTPAHSAPKQPVAPGVNSWGQKGKSLPSKGWGWPKGGAVSPAGFQGKGKGAPDESAASLTEAAFAQITAQLNRPERGGKVWIDEWNWRFAPALGQMRAFMESHPDKFVVIPGEGRKYTVALAGGSGAGAGCKSGKWGKASGKGSIPTSPTLPMPAGAQKRNASENSLEEEPDAKRQNASTDEVVATESEFFEEDKFEQLMDTAINEVENQVKRPGSKGKVWLANWKTKFEPQLGALKNFIEACPDKFRIVDGVGAAYTVELVE